MDGEASRNPVKDIRISGGEFALHVGREQRETSAALWVSGRSVMGRKFHAATVAAKAYRDSPLSRVKRDCVVRDAFA